MKFRIPPRWFRPRLARPALAGALLAGVLAVTLAAAQPPPVPAQAPEAAGTPAARQQPPPAGPQQQDEFVPVDPSEAQEQLPATPLVTIAYAAAWLVIFVYLWSIWRRLGRVERDLAEVGRRVQSTGRH